MTEKAEDQELEKEAKESEKSTTYFTVTPGCENFIWAHNQWFDALHRELWSYEVFLSQISREEKCVTIKFAV